MVGAAQFQLSAAEARGITGAQLESLRYGYQENNSRRFRSSFIAMLSRARSAYICLLEQRADLGLGKPGLVHETCWRPKIARKL